MTSTLGSLYPIINYHLLEPSTGAVSQQFSATQLQNALQFRENQILSECDITVKVQYYPAIAGRTKLPDGTFDIRRIAYLPAQPVIGGYGSGSYGIGSYGINSFTGVPENTILWRDDSWAEQSFNNQWNIAGVGTATPGLPLAYLTSTEPPITFDTDTPPGFAGQYEVITTYSSGNSTNIIIPNDWVHLLKWGALAYLLSTESNAKDNVRSQYCEQRFKLGLKMLQNSSALLTMKIGNIPLQVDSVFSADQYDTRWQAKAANQPMTAYQCGLNMVALSPAPWNQYSIIATVVQNAPLPQVSNDFIQLSQDLLNVIIDYAQHLAAFKMGGQEFMATIPLLQNFLREASIYNSRLSEMGEYTEFLLGLSQLDERRNPRIDTEVTA